MRHAIWCLLIMTLVCSSGPAYALRAQSGLESPETRTAITTSLTGLEEPLAQAAVLSPLARGLDLERIRTRLTALHEESRPLIVLLAPAVAQRWNHITFGPFETAFHQTTGVRLDIKTDLLAAASDASGQLLAGVLHLVPSTHRVPGPWAVRLANSDGVSIPNESLGWLILRGLSAHRTIECDAREAADPPLSLSELWRPVLDEIAEGLPRTGLEEPRIVQQLADQGAAIRAAAALFGPNDILRIYVPHQPSESSSQERVLGNIKTTGTPGDAQQALEQLLGIPVFVIRDQAAATFWATTKQEPVLAILPVAFHGSNAFPWKVVGADADEQNILPLVLTGLLKFGEAQTVRAADCRTDWSFEQVRDRLGTLLQAGGLEEPGIYRELAAHRDAIWAKISALQRAGVPLHIGIPAEIEAVAGLPMRGGLRDQLARVLHWNDIVIEHDVTTSSVSGHPLHSRLVIRPDTQPDEAGNLLKPSYVARDLGRWQVIVPTAADITPSTVMTLILQGLRHPEQSYRVAPTEMATHPTTGTLAEIAQRLIPLMAATADEVAQALQPLRAFNMTFPVDDTDVRWVLFAGEAVDGSLLMNQMNCTSLQPKAVVTSPETARRLIAAGLPTGNILSVVYGKPEDWQQYAMKYRRLGLQVIVVHKLTADAALQAMRLSARQYLNQPVLAVITTRQDAIHFFERYMVPAQPASAETPALSESVNNAFSVIGRFV